MEYIKNIIERYKDKEHEAVEADIWWQLCFCGHW